MTYEPGLEEVENEDEDEDASRTGGFSSHKHYDSDKASSLALIERSYG